MVKNTKRLSRIRQKREEVYKYLLKMADLRHTLALDIPKAPLWLGGQSLSCSFPLLHSAVSLKSVGQTDLHHTHRSHSPASVPFQVAKYPAAYCKFSKHSQVHLKSEGQSLRQCSCMNKKLCCFSSEWLMLLRAVCRFSWLFCSAYLNENAGPYFHF